MELNILVIINLKKLAIKNINGMNGWGNMSEYKKTIQKLIDSDISAYQIQKDIGVATSRISDLRTGKRDLGGISLDTAEKLYEYAKAHLKWIGGTSFYRYNVCYKSQSGFISCQNKSLVTEWTHECYNYSDISVLYNK